MVHVSVVCMHVFSLLKLQEYKQLNPLLSQAMKLQDRTMEEEEEEEDEYEEREYIKTRLPFPRPTEPVISIEKGDVQKGNRQLSK